MDSDIARDFTPFLIIYKDGRIERLGGTDTVPPSLDPKTGVQSKDVPVSPDSTVSARLYLPTALAASAGKRKLSLLVYFHGGGFCIETASSPTYHNYLNAVAFEVGAVVVSVDYRRAPEDPLPLAYDDCWAALRWVASHSTGDGPEAWINDHADLTKVFLVGDSAGANIAHRMGLRLGSDKLDGLDLKGVVLVHPFFWGSEPVGSETRDEARRAWTANFWRMLCPGTSGTDDPMINPGADPSVAGMSCGRVLVFVAGKDVLCSRGWYYAKVLKRSGWRGEVAVVESEGEEHVFHLMDPTCESAVEMMRRLVRFFNGDDDGDDVAP